MKRNERVAAMSRILTDMPMQVFTLSYFCSIFEAAKSTVSEDVELLRQVFSSLKLGRLETITGAAGGIVYIPEIHAEQAEEIAEGLCEKLSGPERALSGGALYLADIIGSPQLMHQVGCLLATPFREKKPDFVLTVEASGIPVALMTARALGVPLVLARRGSTAYEGSAVTINYRASSSGVMQTMSLARRLARAEKKALIIDDFMRAGGTMRALSQLMEEFDCQVVGAGVLLMTREPDKKLIQDVRSVLVLQGIDERKGARLQVSDWVRGARRN